MDISPKNGGRLLSLKMKMLRGVLKDQIGNPTDLLENSMRMRRIIVNTLAEQEIFESISPDAIWKTIGQSEPHLRDTFCLFFYMLIATRLPLS